MELALTDTVQVTKENQISTGDGLPSPEQQMEIPTVQEKIGVTPHTLHERRPLTKNNTQQSSPTDYTQQTKQQRRTLTQNKGKQSMGKRYQRQHPQIILLLLPTETKTKKKQGCQENIGKGSCYAKETGARWRTPFRQSNSSETQQKVTQLRTLG